MWVKTTNSPQLWIITLKLPNKHLTITMVIATLLMLAKLSTCELRIFYKTVTTIIVCRNNIQASCILKHSIPMIVVFQRKQSQGCLKKRVSLKVKKEEEQERNKRTINLITSNSSMLMMALLRLLLLLNYHHGNTMTIMRILCSNGSVGWRGWKWLSEYSFKLVYAYARRISCRCSCTTSKRNDCAVLNARYQGAKQQEYKQ